MAADHGSDQFPGIGLGTKVVTGTVVRPQTIDEVLRRKSWPESAILVVEAIEPSWALVFPRFDAVVSELGGELSHAAILLREAEVPSVINASGAFTAWSRGTSSGSIRPMARSFAWAGGRSRRPALRKPSQTRARSRPIRRRSAC